MKFNKIILGLGVVLIAFTSCNDVVSLELDTNSVEIPEAVSIYDLDLNSFDLTDAQKERIITLSSRKNFNIALQANGNWGTFSTTNSNDAYSLMGKFPEDLTVKLPMGDYSSTTSDNMVWVKEAEFEQAFGNNFSFTLENSSTSEDFSFYVPKKLQIGKLGAPQSMTIQRNTTNLLKWEADPNNELGVILITYFSRNNATDPLKGEIVKSDVLVIKDDGEFDLSSIIKDVNQKSIQFSAFRGNAVVFDENVLFSVVSTDIHIYQIEEGE
jgi:hypothetical protein